MDSTTEEEVQERIVELLSTTSLALNELSQPMIDTNSSSSQQQRVEQLSESFLSICVEIQTKLQEQAKKSISTQPPSTSISRPIPASFISRRALAVELRKVETVCCSLSKIDDFLHQIQQQTHHQSTTV